MTLLSHDFPPDIRVEKEALSLKNSGYDVYLLTRKKRIKSDLKIFKGLKTSRVKWQIRYGLIIDDFLDQVNIAVKIGTICREHGIEIFHVHDLSRTLMIVLLGKLLQRKVVCDVHENYVNVAEPLLRKWKPKLGQVFLAYMRLSERLVCRLSSRIVVATWGLGDRLVGLGVPRGKIITVLNVADTDALKKAKVKPVKTGKLRDKFVVSYVGGFSAHRGLDTLIKALPLVLKEAPNVHLLLVGDGAEKEDLMKLCKELDITDYVSFTGWVPFKEAMRYVQASDLGVIPYPNTPQTEVALPHKLFQYMYYEKPLIVSNVKSLKKMMEETGCGMVFKAGDPKDLAKKIMNACNNQPTIIKMGKKGKKSVNEKYNWNNEKKKLLQIYSKIKFT